MDSGKPDGQPLDRFVVCHHSESAFTNDGFRPYALYRDLGFVAATDGRVRAHVVRMIPPWTKEEVGKRHYHLVKFHMVYLLKGWAKFEFEGHGEVTLRPGSAWIQPRGIKHTVLGYSDDCEMLEITMPADYDTVNV